MKTKQLLLGLLSSFFLSVGLVRAAEMLDPVFVPTLSSAPSLTATECSSPCSLPVA